MISKNRNRNYKAYCTSCVKLTYIGLWAYIWLVGRTLARYETIWWHGHVWTCAKAAYKCFSLMSNHGQSRDRNIPRRNFHNGVCSRSCCWTVCSSSYRKCAEAFKFFILQSPMHLKLVKKTFSFDLHLTAAVGMFLSCNVLCGNRTWFQTLLCTDFNVNRKMNVW